MTETHQRPTGQQRIDVEALGMLNYLGELGVTGVEARLGKLAGKPTAVESTLVKSGYVDETTVNLAFSADQRLGVRVRLDGAPYGCVLVLFPPSSANRAVQMMLADTDETVEEVSNEMAVSSVVELSGIVANGFLDALADTFDQHIATWPPVTRNSELSTVVERALADDEDQERGLYIETKLHITSHDIEVELYLFPETETFVEILNRLDVETIVAEMDR